MKTPVVAAIVAVALLLSGCTEHAAGPNEDDGKTPFEFDYAAASWPTAAGARAYLDSYVMEHPYRVWFPAGDNQYMIKARNSLESELKSFGLRVERQVYSSSGTNILGFIEGTENPDEWVVLTAHYDTTESTVYGAWDDGAGVAVLLEIAKAVKDWKFPFTVVFGFMDEEEQDLLGSKAFVKWANKQDHVKLVANLNTDPPGLNWPCADAQGPLPLVVWPDVRLGTVGMKVLLEAVESGLDKAEVPKDVRAYPGGIPIVTAAGQGLRGTSDHDSFAKAKVPNLFLGSAPVVKAGTGPAEVAVLSYALHTPLDSAEQMEARCGNGRLAEGMGVIATALAQALVELAKQPSLDLDTAADKED